MELKSINLISNYHFSGFKKTSEVVGCFIQCQQKVLFLKRHLDKPQGNTWSIPAGKIEKNEDYSSAVIREVFEETNVLLDPQKIEKVATFYVRHLERDFVFLAYKTLLNEFPKIELALNENIQFLWISPTKALKLNLIYGGGEILETFLSSK